MVEWYIREYQCANGVCEKTKFPVFRDAMDRDGTRRHRRTVNRAEKLTAESAREVALLMNNNFTAGQDCYLTLDYSQEGIDRLIMRAGTDGRDEIYISAEKEAENYMKRLRRACRAAGVELKSIYVTSDMDGESFEPVRVHHHLVVNREAAVLAESCWKAGGAKAKSLYGPHGDLTELARYMIAQARPMPGRHRYHPSRTLEKPERSEPILARSPDAPLRVPAGCEFIWRSETSAGRAQTIRYYRPPEKRRKARKRKGGDHP